MENRLTHKNPNTGTYRASLHRAGTFRIESQGDTCALFGDLVDRLGMYEDCLSLQEAMEYRKKT